MTKHILSCLLFLLSLPALANESTLFPDTFLFYGQTIVSPSCYYFLTMQTDGNLVLYEGPRFQGRARWASGTVGRKGYAIMQADGNLVMYSWNGRPFFATNTHGHPGSRLVLQDDGNLVVYSGGAPLWATNTHQSERIGISPCEARSSLTTREADTNRFGGDYQRSTMSTNDPTVCAYWCSQDQRCKAYTYVPPGVQGNAPVCWFKNSVPERTGSPGLVSGVVYGR